MYLSWSIEEARLAMGVTFDRVRLGSTAVGMAGILQALVVIAAATPATMAMARRSIDTSGLISIDCGLATGSYYLEGTNLYYTSDDSYVSSGKRVAITSSSASADADARFKTVRAFPDGARNCYTLWPVQPQRKYLIRAWFLYDNYDGASSVPGFDLHVGVDFWVTVTIQSAGDKFGTEIIYYVADSDSVDVCLVNTGHGTPFISALDLRPLGNAAYAATTHVSLRMFNRWDAGPTAYRRDDRLYNHTDDVYDRVWFYSKSAFWEEINTNKSIKVPIDNTFKVPTGVLATAAEQIKGAANFSITHQVNDPTAKLYVYWHFAELQALGPNQIREFDILVPYGPNPNGYKFGPVNPSYLTLNTIQSTQIHLNGSNTFSYALKRTRNSTLLPIVNAVEVYLVIDRHLSPTNKLDVDVVASIKKTYNITRNWQGDPCLPITYKWDALFCVYNDTNQPRITALDLASSNLTGELPASLSNLTLLHALNLSHNGFTGKIPEFLGLLPNLKIIDLSRNNLSGPVPAQLAEKARNKSIVLRLAGNSDVCKSFPCEKEDVVTKKKRPNFIIPLVASISVTLLIVIGGLVLIAFRNREKQVDQAIKSRNKQFNYSEIVKITNNFKKTLGKGAFGSVYYGLLQDNTQVAVKILNNSTCPITFKQFCVEAELLMKIHHINLVSLVGYCDERSKMALVCEYMSNGNLQMRLSEKIERPLSWKTRLDILIDTAQGLEYLHSGCQPQIIHRDVKPANILLDDAGHAKISDFGLSRYFTTYSQAIAMTDLAGTPGYCDPEYVQMNTLSEKSDVYSFGVVLMELITGQPALVTRNPSKNEFVHIVDWVKKVADRGDISKIVDESIHGEINANSAWRILEIGMGCVKPRGDERPMMSEVVAELKLCYASEQIDLPNDGEGNDNDYHEYKISGYPDSSIGLDRSSDSLLPSAR